MNIRRPFSVFHPAVFTASGSATNSVSPVSSLIWSFHLYIGLPVFCCALNSWLTMFSEHCYHSVVDNLAYNNIPLTITYVMHSCEGVLSDVAVFNLSALAAPMTGCSISKTSRVCLLWLQCPGLGNVAWSKSIRIDREVWCLLFSRHMPLAFGTAVNQLGIWCMTFHVLSFVSDVMYISGPVFLPYNTQ